MASFNFDLEIFCDINAERLAISVHKMLEYSRSEEGDQLGIDRSQSFCLLQSVCYNPTLVIWLCLMFAYSQIGT